MAETQNLTQKLLNVQRDLKAPKGQFNNFGKYKYRSAEDILEAVKPLNAREGILLTISDEPMFIGDWHYIKATASITDGKDTHIVTAFARESQAKKGMDDSQITGTASSYARKYALNGMYLIDDTKDADTNEHRNQTNNAPRQQEKMASNDQLGLLNNKTQELSQLYNMDVNELKSKLGIKQSHTEKEFKHLLTRVNDGINKASKQ